MDPQGALQANIVQVYFNRHISLVTVVPKSYPNTI